MAGAGTHVRVTRSEDGTVLISAHADAGPDAGQAADPAAGHAGSSGEPAAAGPDFTRSVLDVAGATLAWPVLGEPAVPAAEIHDAGRAQQWLWAVYGEPVAAAVHDAEAGQSAGARVRAATPDLADAAARLGFAHWAARWWPASYPDGIPALEPDVHGLETAALTHRCQQLFDDHDDQGDACVAELIEDHRAALAPLLQWWHAATQPASTARHLDAVLRLVDDAADCSGLDGTALRRLRTALGRGPDHGRTVLPAGPAALFARRDGYALAAGEPFAAGGRVIARGTGTNDWRRYPPGLVDAAEHAVSWTARALGARRQIEVEVVAHVAAPATGAPLVAEVRVNGGPPARVPLARRDDVWTGRGDVDLTEDPPATTPAPRLDVAVLLPGFDPGAGPEARAGRDAIRALARRRLAAAARPVADGARAGVAGPFLAETLAASASGEDY